MPRNAETGRQGLVNGYSNADQIAAIIGATRLSNVCNEYQWKDRKVVIKSGPSAVVTRAMLARVAAVVYGEVQNGGWIVYEIDPDTYARLSVQSQSSKHDENYRLVRRTQIRGNGRRVYPA